MKIQGTGGYTPIEGLLQRERVEGEAKAARPLGGQSQASEKVEISPEGREIQRLKAILDQMPDVRLERVEEIRTKILEGRYQIDLDKLSDTILEALLRGEI